MKTSPTFKDTRATRAQGFGGSTILIASLIAACLFAPGCGKAKGEAKGDAHGKATPAAGAHGAVTWEELKVEDGSFTASFPGKPIVQFRQSEEGKQVLCGLDLPGDIHYSIIMNQINEKDSGPPVKERLKELLAQAALSYGAGAKVESQKENFKVGDNPAVEYTLSFTNQGKKLKLRCRAFFAHDSHQLFQLMAAGPQEPPDAKQFLDSFKLGTYTPGKAEPKPTPKASATKSGH